jgi:hypothetical protein
MIGLASTVAGVTLSSLAMAAEDGAAQLLVAPQLSPVERFKSLLTSPPVIERLVYSIALPNAGHVAVSLDTGLAGATNHEYYELRWQPNAMLHRQLTAPDQTIDDLVRGRCFRLWEDQFYFLDARTRPSLYVLERQKAARGMYPDAYHAAHIRMTEALQPINLGISHLYPGMVRWNGDTFDAVSMADKKPIWIRGRISRICRGVPEEIKVQYSNDMGMAEYRIAYEYHGYRAPWYPDRIASHLLRGKTEILYSDFAILSVAAASAPLNQSHFEIASSRQEMEDSLLYLTNNSIYAKLASGRFIETPAAIPARKLSVADYYRNRFYYAAVTIWTFAILVLGFRTWQQNRTNQRRMES